MVEFISVQSSNIRGVAYDITSQTLTVDFVSGSRYSYSGVPQEEYQDFMDAPSKGEYFAENIKGVYSYTRD